ncbi:MAG: hypothetical protein U0136_14880 [Bdellovibrionota bacterium]
MSSGSRQNLSIPFLADAASPQLPPAQELSETGCELPETARRERFAAEFLRWHSSTHGLGRPASPRDVQEWAKTKGLKLDASQTVEILDEYREQLKELKDALIFSTVPRSDPMPLTNMLLRQVASEKDAERKKKESEESENQPRPLEKGERERKADERHHEVKAVTVNSPAFCDQMSAETLKMKLRMNAIEPEDVAGVEQFLAELRAELRRKQESSRSH